MAIQRETCAWIDTRRNVIAEESNPIAELRVIHWDTTLHEPRPGEIVEPDPDIKGAYIRCGDFD